MVTKTDFIGKVWSPTQTNYRSGGRSRNHDSFTTSLNLEVLLLLVHCDTDKLFAKDSVNISFLADGKNLNNKIIRNFNISKLYTTVHIHSLRKTVRKSVTDSGYAYVKQ